MATLLRMALLALALTGALEAQPYHLMRGDQVDIRVFDRPDLSSVQRIDCEGKLRLPVPVGNSNSNPLMV